mgnify:CR=1 FL=1
MDNNDFMEYNPSPFSNGFSMLNTYAEDLSKKEYVTNPAIAREEEIKKLILVLLSPEKSAVLTGKPGIGKTAIVEGLNYLIQRKEVPNALLNTKIYKINTSSLLGTYTNDGVEDSKLQLLINEIMGKKDIILFIDEIHTLVTASKNGDHDLLLSLIQAQTTFVEINNQSQMKLMEHMNHSAVALPEQKTPAGYIE